MTTAKPTPKQLEYQDWELGMFLHFGVRTFYEGHRDWDGKPMSPANFNPAELDCDQWVTTAKAAGFNYIVLTAKHHDGFANWPSAYTDFSVAASPWKGGKGDVVQEFLDACHRHGIHPGLYYSPADASQNSFKADAKAYDDYFLNQISEILHAGRGEVRVLWFDGCGSQDHQYDWGRIIPEIRKMQPKVAIFNMGDPDFRWVGNEAGIAPVPCWNTVKSVPLAVDTDRREAVGAQPTWLPAECDCRMRLQNWFYSDQDEDTVKSLDELMGLYYYSVGRGCNLLINIGPDRRGLLPDHDANRLIEFGREIRGRFSRPLLSLADFHIENGRWTCTPPAPIFIDHAVLQEDLSDGEHVRRFAVKALPTGGGEIALHEGHNIGHKAVCRFPLIAVRKIIVEVREADGPVKLRQIAVFDTTA